MNYDAWLPDEDFDLAYDGMYDPYHNDPYRYRFDGYYDPRYYRDYRFRRHPHHRRMRPHRRYW